MSVETAQSGYETTLRTIGRTLAKWLDRLWQQYTAGELDRETFLELCGLLVTVSNAQAATLARQSFASYVAIERGAPPPAVAAEPPAYLLDPRRVGRAVSTILSEPERAPQRLERLAMNEPIQTATSTFQTAGREAGAQRWVRGLDANPCQLCRWWWRNGQSWPMSHTMPRHKGCACVPLPVIQ